MRLELRCRCYAGVERSEREWPIARTRYTKLSLQSSQRYVSTDKSSRAVFDWTFDERTDLIGHAKLKVWMSSPEADDLDIFVALQKLDAQGSVVPFAYFAQFEDGPVALGWLRGSHREIDAARSSAYQPVLAHQRERKLAPGEEVALEIEIWPSGTRFEAGERLRLVVQGTDIYPHARPCVQDLHEASVNRGEHVILAGGRYDSHLLVPVVGD